MGTPAWQARDHQRQELQRKLIDKIVRRLEEINENYESSLVGFGSKIIQFVLEKDSSQASTRGFFSREQLMSEINRDPTSRKVLIWEVINELHQFSVIESELNFLLTELGQECISKGLIKYGAEMQRDALKVVKKVFGVDKVTDEVDY
jgi:hypothetical protein